MHDKNNLQIGGLSSELNGDNLQDVGSVGGRLEELNRLHVEERQQADALNAQGYSKRA